MTESYLTLKKKGQGTYKEKGSKFLAFAYPVSSKEAIENILLDLKKQFHDARHYCYAWKLGIDQIEFKANDDGEPGHSAGDPILGQIKSCNITNSLVVVVRYFGGTKLGVGGLINAYRTAAADALADAGILAVDIKHEVAIHYSYEATNEVMRAVEKFHVEIVSQDFKDECVLNGKVKPSLIEPLKAKFELFKQMGIAARLVT